MIKPLNVPQLSSVKARTGLQSIGELLPRLIRQYELQAELMKRREEHSQKHAANENQNSQNMPQVAVGAASGQQATFGWYE